MTTLPAIPSISLTFFEEWSCLHITPKFYGTKYEKCSTIIAARRKLTIDVSLLKASNPCIFLLQFQRSALNVNFMLILT
jgi:hypothetical protein